MRDDRPTEVPRLPDAPPLPEISSNTGTPRALGQLFRSYILAQSADGLVIDTSGIWIVDSHLCAGLGKLATAASIMGVPSVLCGLSADVVMTLESMGFELTETQTATSLEHAMEKLGIFVERRAQPAKEHAYER